MKIPTVLTLLALLFNGLNATTTGGGVSSHQVIITYPKETSPQMLAEARHQIEKAVGFPFPSARQHLISLSLSLPFFPSIGLLNKNLHTNTTTKKKGGEILHDFGT